MSDPTIEAAIDAAIHWTPSPYEIDTEDRRAYGALVDEILKVVTPLIRAQVLEEAIRVTEKHFVGIFTGWVGHAPITLEEAETIANECSLLCAADIRRLKGKP